MRSKGQVTKQVLKLPSIGNRTMSDMSAELPKQKQRPSSSKNIVNDLEKKLFSQLDALQQKSSTNKTIKKSIGKRVIRDPNGLTQSSKDISNGTSEFSNLDKIAQLMPNLYSKILQTKKQQEISQPLKQSSLTLNNLTQPCLSTTLITQLKVQQNDQKLKPFQKCLKTMNSLSISRSISTQKPQKQQNSTNSNLNIINTQQQPQYSSSFQMADMEVNRIYNQYLQMEGLQMGEGTSIRELKQINKDLQVSQVDIAALENNYHQLMQQLGSLCMDDLDMEESFSS